jgi:STE24 endopeptidase
MSRILLLLIFLLWMAWTSRPAPGTGGSNGGVTAPVTPRSDNPERNTPPAIAPVAPRGTRAAQQPAVAPVAADPRVGVPVFLGFYALLLGVMRLWSRLLARNVTADSLDRSLRRFSKVMLVARLMVPTWFGIGLFLLGWGPLVNAGFESVYGAAPLLRGLQLPGVLVGTFPAFLAWVGLWWSQYPADHSLREHNLVDQLEAGQPVYAPPTFREYFTANLRLQVLFTVAPVLAIVTLRDGLALALRPFLSPGSTISDTIEFVAMLGSTVLVFVLAPEMLRRVLQTQPLPDSPLRRRLEQLCRRVGMRYRDILLWHTQNNMGNAAVMGMFPPVRYILLSDLLLERMDDEQIEAVFAHEVGHVVHRHMAWYVVVIMIFTLGLVSLEQVAKYAGPAPAFVDAVPQELRDVLSVVAPMAGFLMFFGFLSRRFERQADVYAARIMESSRPSPAASPPPAGDPSPATHVGPYGATVFASALHRVAVMNNIPLVPRRRPRRGFFRRIGHSLDLFVETIHNWFHGSVPHRMAYLRNLSADPALTGRFDRFMLRLYCTLLFALFASAAFVVASSLR